MSVIQNEELVAYQLRCGYLTEIADGVGERLITLNEGFMNSSAFKAVAWQANPDLVKRCYSPPIPTAIASEYFQAPRQAGVTLEDEPDEAGMLNVGGTDTMGPGSATRRRRRRETLEEDDSSDLSDESEDDDAGQRAAQQIKFAKMPVRSRAGSSPIQSSQMRQSPAMSPRAPPAARRGSQSALEIVKERARRDTVTSSEVSSENELDGSSYQKQREAARAAVKSVKLQTKIMEEPTLGIRRAGTDLLPEEEDDSDGSDMSGAYIESIDSASILDAVNPDPPPQKHVVGTPPREFTRTATVRKSQAPPRVLQALPPPRPMSTIRPMSMIAPKSLLSAALKARKTKPKIPFENFASLSGQGENNPIAVRIFLAFSRAQVQKPHEVLIRRMVHHGEGGDRPVTVAELIGLALWKYQEAKRERPIPREKANINWWSLRMVEEDGEIDDDFPPFERTKALTSFTTANNRAAGRMRANSKTHDNFGLILVSDDEFEENQRITPQPEEEMAVEEAVDEDPTPRNTPQPDLHQFTPVSSEPRPNPVTNTTYRQQHSMFADAPQAPAAAPSNPTRGHQKLLRVHLHSTDVAPGQLVTIDTTTETYMAEVLDLVCRKRQLDKAIHVLKMPGGGPVILPDTKVLAIGTLSDLELHRRRFATDGPLALTGSPGSASPKLLPFSDGQPGRKGKKTHIMGSHPLAQEAIKQAELTSAYHKTWVVWRLRTVRMINQSEKRFEIDGEYVHIKPTSRDSKTTTAHISQVIGCKVSSKHPNQFKLFIYRDTESKRYDFEAKSVEEAHEIVNELRKGVSQVMG
ncbi:Target of rapamycin complex 2 subunit sin1 [Colletotrichum orbiculare MAFF 240422]|uniref:Target of rapamycin complex 2 subunit sin1 n=2 Tax=Colletotrichum orbiculare species complex TaxID=2707354 RepID=N4UTA0_COLOR|nr:Target of rapamycin complex 2 subunit sin1 [Colletotrichum orbiculare MAFF 240422]TDZ36398.1 Target of rapamycin complex 2 subunit sin1 [Colletotrichum spinosum]